VSFFSGAVITASVCNYVGDMCTVVWRGEKYNIECTPSHLLALAVALASAEGASHIDIYRQLVNQVVEMRQYRETARRVDELLREKQILKY
jgi:transcription elongation factor Elf1